MTPVSGKYGDVANVLYGVAEVYELLVASHTGGVLPASGGAEPLLFNKKRMPWL